VRVAPGGGARHLCVHPAGRTVYCNEESGGVVHVFGWDSGAGVLKPQQVIATTASGETTGVGIGVNIKVIATPARIFHQ
jgi:6-phosphogluconolactonase (cycloisomerase 2 family)